MWDFMYRQKLQTLELGDGGHLPLEVRFLHNPNASEGYVCCALESTVHRFFKNEVHLFSLHAPEMCFSSCTLNKTLIIVFLVFERPAY